MKKITLALAVALCAVTGANAQVIEIPPNNGANSALRAPDGTQQHAYQRTVMYIHPSEIPMKLATLNTFSFQYTNGTGSIPVAGNFTVYMVNTTDASYLKGANFATAIAGMTTVYNGVYTVPASVGAATVGVTLNTPFTYTGGGLYVAWDWASTGPFSAASATYLCNNASPAAWLGSINSSVTPIPTTLGGSLWRPSLLIGAVNTATNEVEVMDIIAQGKVAKVVNTPEIITSEITNWGSNAVNNLTVTLSAAGANPYSTTQVINLPATTSTVLTWNAYNPLNNGTSTITVTSNHADQIPSNNSRAWTQSVTCDYISMSPPTATFNTGVGFNSGTGIMALAMAPQANASLTAIRVGISSSTTNPGVQISGVLMDATGTILDYSTNTITINAGMYNTFQMLNFTKSSLTDLTANTPYLFGVLQHTAGSPVGAIYETTFPAPLAYVATSTTGTGAGPIDLGLWLAIEAQLAFPGMVLTTSSPNGTVFCAGTTQVWTLTAAGAQSYTWSSPATLGNGQTFTWVPTVSGSGTFTNIIVNGSYTSGVMTGCRTNSVNMLFQQSACTGINEAAFAEVQLFPNPAVNGKSTIKGLNGANTISVYNTLGQAVISEKVAVETYSLDLSSAPAGSYIVKITNDANETKIIKFVNQR